MSVAKYSRIEVTCDGCNRASFNAEPADSQGEARVQAASHGWQRVRGKDLCPECVLGGRYPHAPTVAALRDTVARGRSNEAEWAERILVDAGYAVEDEARS